MFKNVMTLDKRILGKTSQTTCNEAWLIHVFIPVPYEDLTRETQLTDVIYIMY